MSRYLGSYLSWSDCRVVATVIGTTHDVIHSHGDETTDDEQDAHPLEPLHLTLQENLRQNT